MDFARRSAIVVASRSPIFFLRKPLEHSPCLRVMARRFLARRRRRDGRWFPVILLLVGMSFVACAPAAHAQQEKQQAGDPRLQEAERLFQEGRAAAKARDFRKAIPLYEQALALREHALGKEHPQLVPLTDALGAAHRALGSYSAALPYYQRSLAIDEKTLGSDHADVAEDLNNLAVLYDSMGEYAKALPLYQRSLAISEKALGAEHPTVARSLNNLAALYWRMGEYAKALPLHERSLAIREKALGAEHPSVAMSLNNLALLYKSMGEYAKALPLYQRSLAINEKALGVEHSDVAQSLNNLALLYDSMGEYAKALPLYQSSLAIFEKVHGREHPLVATSLNNLALLYRSMGEYAKALPLHERSLAIREKALGPEHPDVATDLNNLAVLYQSMGEYAKALPLYQRSLAINEKALGVEHPDVAQSLYNLAGLYHSMGEYAKALPLVLRALRIATQANAPEALWRVQDGLRVVLAREKQPELAIFFGKQAVNTIQGLRARLTELDRGLQRSFLQNKTDVYRGLADLLVQQGRLAEAQQVLSMLKEEEFFDFIRRSESDDPRKRRISFLAYEQPWHERLRQLIERLRKAGAEKAELERQVKLGVVQPDKARLAVLERQSAEAARELDRFYREIAAAFAALAATQVRETADAEANRAALQQTLTRLGAGAVVLHYVQADERLNIILTTATSQVARQVPIKSAELNKQIDRLRRVLRNPRSNPLPAAQDLYKALIAPVAADLEKAGAKTLMLYLDGTLRYIPLAVLHDGKEFLAERYALAVYTEVARENLTIQPPGGRTIVGLGLTRGMEEYAPLPAVKAELEAIVKSGATGLIPGEVHLDDHFSARTMQQALAKGRPLVHIASHFVFRPGTEATSFLLLGDGDRLTLKRVRDEKFDFARVDLLTLSACETGLGGGRDADGQEIEGLGVLVQKQGAKGVIATLWPVADESTALFMQRFYRLREQGGLNKAEALRQAQLAFIRGASGAASAGGERGAARRALAETPVPSSRGYSHPYYWAPFILMGNWL